jgi:hypothetical protein
MLEPTQCEDPHVERMIEAFAFLACSRPPQDRRRVPRDHRSPARGRLPALRPPDPFDVHRRTVVGSRERRPDYGLRPAAPSSVPVLSTACRSASAPASTSRCGRSWSRDGLEIAGPPRCGPQVLWRHGRAAHGGPLCARRAAGQAQSAFAALLSQRRSVDDPFAVRVAVQQHGADPAPRSHAQLPQAPHHPACLAACSPLALRKTKR